MITHVISDVSYESFFKKIDKIIESKKEQKKPTKLGIEIPYDFTSNSTLSIPKIALQLAVLIEVIDRLNEAKNSSKIGQNFIILQCRLSGQFYYDISYVRSIKKLWGMIARSYESNNIPPVLIHCISEKKINPIEDDYNYLQHVSNSLAAVTAGCDVLSINDTDIDSNLRANISNLLRDEAQLNQVYDPYAGSYMVEHITEELIQESLSTLQKIEKEGGILSYI